MERNRFCVLNKTTIGKKLRLARGKKFKLPYSIFWNQLFPRKGTEFNRLFDGTSFAYIHRIFILNSVFQMKECK